MTVFWMFNTLSCLFLLLAWLHHQCMVWMAYKHVVTICFSLSLVAPLNHCMLCTCYIFWLVHSMLLILPNTSHPSVSTTVTRFTIIKPIYVIIDVYISTQKQPSCKKGRALFRMASVKKAVKSKGNGCDSIGWW